MPCIAPRTLTQAEQELVLRVTAGHPRDHAIISIALGTGLRLAELVALDVADLFTEAGEPRTRVHVRAEIAKGGRAADCFLPDALTPKLRRLWRYKRERSESLDPRAPLFCAQSRCRISKRRIQVAWHAWQQRAGFTRPLPIHALRHSAITNLHRATHDLLLTQRFARHASPLTTITYCHPSDEEAWAQVRALPC